MVYCLGFAFKLPATISSRVRGQVFDKETNQPIAGAEVHLIELIGSLTSLYEKPTEMTDSNGIFLFDDVPLGRYFLEVQKSGYTTFRPEYMFQENRTKDFFNVFTLKKGQIKHQIIKMERGGRLKVSIKKKTDKGITGFQDLSISLHKVVRGGDIDKLKDIIAAGPSIITDERGEVVFDGLIPGDVYFFLILKDGLPSVKKKSLIKKNDTVELYHTYDFTDITGVSGQIQFNQTSILHSVIILIKIENNRVVTSLDITRNVKYSLVNIPPGKYLLKAFAAYDDDSETKKDFLLNIVKGKSTILNLKL